MENDRLVTTKEAADFLKMHVESVRRLAREGKIPSLKFGKDWRFDRKALLRWAQEHRSRGKKPRILIVDDDESIRRLVRQILKEEDFDFREASNGAEGIALMEQEEFHLVFLDLVMPEMNGPQFLEKLSTMEKDVPVIIITGFPDSQLMMEAMAYGPITLLAKPIDQAAILNAVRLVIKGRDNEIRSKGVHFE